MLTKPRIALALVTIGLCTVVLTSPIVGLYIYRKYENYQIEISIEQGDKVVDAIEEFRRSDGQSPKSLSELVPDYLEEIPQPSWGTRSWNYEIELDSEGYFLEVRKGEGYYEHAGYYSSSGEWIVDQ